MLVKVAEGDTLEQIADKYHTSPEQIAHENALSEPILPGMRLVVSGYILHLWMPGDTVERVAARYAVAPSAVGENMRIGSYVKIEI